VAGLVSYFAVFARVPALRDHPWLNVALVLAGVGLGMVGSLRAWRRGGIGRKLVAGLALGLALAPATLLLWYVFDLSYRLPAPTEATLALVEAPDLELSDQDGTTVRLSELRGQPVLLVFYRGFW
jgi:hypothetical protein